MTYFRGDGGGQRILLAPVVSQVPSNIQYAKVPYFGVVCLESYHYTMGFLLYLNTPLCFVLAYIGTCYFTRNIPGYSH